MQTTEFLKDFLEGKDFENITCPVLLFSATRIEGASSVGKSTRCREIEERHNFYSVPVVHFLFERPGQKRRYFKIKCLLCFE